MPVILYFISILLTAALNGYLAVYAWRRRSVPGSRAYARLALAQFLLALAECLSLLSPTPALALVWFRLRFLALATIPILWLLFALEYGGRRGWLSRPLVAALFIIPVVTQALHWSNGLHGLWLKHEVTFTQGGPFWLADTGARIPGPGFLVHAFYAILLLVTGIVLLFITAWQMRRQLLGQALLVAGAGLVALAFGIISTFNLLPRAAFNLFTPGMGLSVLLIALGIFRFQFLKRAPAAETSAPTDALATQTRRSLALFLLIFIVMATGITTGGYLSFQAYERQYRSQVEAQLSAIAELKVNELSRWRSERQGDAQVIRQNPLFAALVERYLDDAADAQTLSALQGWLDSLRSAFRYDQILLLDPAGAVRMASPTSDALTTPHLTQEMAATLSTKQVTWLDFHHPNTDSRIHLSLLVPIYAESGDRPLGLLVLHIDPTAYLFPFIQEWPVPSATAETLLVRRDGDDILFLNDLKSQADTALNLRLSLTETQLPAVQAVLGREGIVEGEDYRGEPVIADVRPVPDSPWFLVAKVNASEVYAPLRERAWGTVALFGILLLAAGIGLTLVWRQQRVRYYRRQAEAAEALRASEEKFALAFQHSPYAIILTRPEDGCIVEVNDAFCTISGFTRAEALSDSSVNLNLWVSIEERSQVVQDLLQGTAVIGREFQFRKKNGEVMTGLFSADTLMLSNDRVILSSINDITERKRAEEAIREGEQRYRSLIQHAPDAIFVNFQDRVVLVNRACLALFGAHSAAELLDKSIYDLFDPDIHTSIRQRIHILRDMGEPVPAMTERVVRLDGGRVDVEVTAAPFPYGGVNAIHVLLRDITARKEADAQIQAAQTELQRLLAEAEQSRVALLSVVEDLQAAEAETRHLNAELEARVEARTRQLYEAQEQIIQQERLAVIGQLAGGMGHELRNPLGVISNASYYLQFIQPRAKGKVKEYLGIIDKEVRIAEKIITDLLDLTHAEMQEPERVPVQKLAHDLLTRLPAPERVRVTLDLPPDLPAILVDPHQLAKALDNLVINAYQAMPEGGEIVLRGQESGDRGQEAEGGGQPSAVDRHFVALSVHDTGAGIHPDHLSKLFDPIFTTKSAKGFGLGLPVSKRLIEVNGGRIEVHSEVGIGSVFTVYLPIASDVGATP